MSEEGEGTTQCTRQAVFTGIAITLSGLTANRVNTVPN